MAMQSCLVSELRGLKHAGMGNATEGVEDNHKQRVKQSFLKQTGNLDYMCKIICGGVNVHIASPESSNASASSPL